jgi:hypothetical protein
MGKIIHKRLSAATIIEAIVAMVIILVLFGITTTVLVQTSVHSFSIKKIKATQLVNTYFTKTATEKAFFNEEIVLDDLTIRKEVQPYSRNEDLLAVKITVLDNNDKELETGQRLMRFK